ncbi:MP1 [Nootka lupine vein clearing virus]|uniref:MP1 n=1 Tax=Nootka lupine vein clearing virus TaxID=283876 RepID=A2TJT0_9TOMB|nr:MP1 [Nootka lupine vein clearing virus]ABM92361.1 MP1 [Nootka lupine vein clearing virus]
MEIEHKEIKLGGKKKPRQAVGSKGRGTGKRLVAHAAVDKDAPKGNSGGSYVFVADTMEVRNKIVFNF